MKRKKSTQKVSEGVRLYNQIGGCFLFVGVASLVLMGFVALLPQDTEKYNVPLLFGIWAGISLFLILLGALPLILGRVSEKYRVWIEKEVQSFGARQRKKQ